MHRNGWKNGTSMGGSTMAKEKGMGIVLVNRGGEWKKYIYNASHIFKLPSFMQPTFRSLGETDTFSLLYLPVIR